MSKNNLDPKQVEEFLILNPDFLSDNSSYFKLHRNSS